MVTKLGHLLKQLNEKDPVRLKITESLVEKMYSMGLTATKGTLAQCERVAVSAMARRRLPVVLVRMGFAQNMTDAVRMVEHGHIRVGTQCITDPAFLVTRQMQDYVGWVDGSKYKRAVMKYNDKLDDFDLLH
jgi:U3 small nucleolar ribonucleoprotein protein IMP3